MKALGRSALSLAVAAALVLSAIGPPPVARAAFAPYVGYQAKLADNLGAAVADGDYNVEFKLYDAASSGTLLWTETRTGANKVTVTDGLFSVLLGDVTAIAGVNFDQPLWLTVNIGGTGTPSWDGEMTPRRQLSSVPSAFIAEKAHGLDATYATSTYATSTRVYVGTSLNVGTTSSAAALAVQGSALFSGNLGLANLTATGTATVGGLSVGALAGPLQAIAGAVSATSTMSVAYGGTGLSSAPTYGQVLVGNAAGGYTLTATSSLGIAGGGGSVTADSLNFTDMSDTMALDASTAVGFGASTYGLTFTNDGSGNETHNLTSTGDFVIQNNGADVFTVNDSGDVIANSDVYIGAQADTASTGDAAYSLLNSAAGTWGAEVSRDKVASAVVYEGKLFVATAETDAAGIYRWDGGTTWTLVTSSTLGRAISGDATDADAFVMTVFDGELWIGSQNGAATAGVYKSSTVDTASAGDNFTLVNSARGTINGTAQIGISDMTVYNGQLIVATQKANAAEIARYEGGTTFTRINPTVGKSAAETTADKDAFVLTTCNNVLWSGGISGAATAIVAAYQGNGTTWINTTVTATGANFGAETLTSDIDSLACYNGSLFMSSSKTAGNAAAIYYYKGAVPVANVAANWVRVNPAVGKMLTADAAVIDKFILRPYKGRLYAGSQTATGDGAGAVFEYPGIPRADWTLMTTGARGTFGSETGVDSVTVMQELNGTLYIGTDDLTAGIGSMYSWAKLQGNSFGLRFDSGNGNYGTMSFVAGAQTADNAGHHGSFLLSNSIMLASAAYDVAEDYPTRDVELAPADLVSLDSLEPGLVRRSSGRGDKNVVGIYSENPALRLSQPGEAIEGTRAVPVALVGRVPVRVTLDGGPIGIGDYLTAAPTPGAAMRASRPGRVVGRAISSYSGAEGEEARVTVFIGTETIGWDEIAIAEVQAVEAVIVDTITQLLSDVGTATEDLALASIAGADDLSQVIAEKIVAVTASVKKMFVEALTILPGGGINVPAGENQISGSAVLPAGATGLDVGNDAVRLSSKIFLTPISALSSPLVVTQKTDGIGFRVEIAVPQPADVHFDWLIVQTYRPEGATDVVAAPIFASSSVASEPGVTVYDGVADEADEPDAEAAPESGDETEAAPDEVGDESATADEPAEISEPDSPDEPAEGEGAETESGDSSGSEPSASDGASEPSGDTSGGEGSGDAAPAE